MKNKKADYKLVSKILLASLIVNLAGFSASTALAETSKNNAVSLEEVTLTSDGKFVDKNGEEVSNVITKYTTEEVTKYYDRETGKQIDADERDEGKIYIPVKTTKVNPHYYASSLQKTEYGEGDKQETYTISSNQTVVYKYSDENTIKTRTKNPTGTVFEKNVIGSTWSTQENSKYCGGGLYLDSSATNIEGVEGDFVKNSVKTTSTSNASYGGAIANESANGDGIYITGNFIGNSLTAGDATVYGGAISNGNNSKIGQITGDFIGNSASSSSSAIGGAIYNNGTIAGIEGNFIENKVTSSSTADLNYARGGAIAIEGSAKIGDITGDFIGNYIDSKTTGFGGAIYNSSAKIESITGDFIGNYTKSSGKNAHGGAIYNSYSGSTFKTITGDFIGNHVEQTGNSGASGGAIYNNSGEFELIKGNFYGNYVKSQSDIKQVTSTANSGAIYNGGTMTVEGNFVNNWADADKTSALGGAIYNTGDLTIKNSSFYNNYAKSNYDVKGGAIYSTNDVTIIADDGNTYEFKGNYTELNGNQTDNAIYMERDDAHKWTAIPTLTIEANNNSRIVFWDSIDGKNGTAPYGNEEFPLLYYINLTSEDGTGVISLYNDIKNGHITASNVTIDFVDNNIRNYDILSLTSDDTVKYNIDVRLGDATADTLTIGSSTEGSVVKLGMINLLDDYNGTPVTIQILKTTDPNIKLELSDNMIIKQFVEDVVYNDSIIMEADAIVLSGNDSITIQGQVYDALDVITSSDSSDNRSFIFETNDKYIVRKDLSETAEGTFNIQGINKINSIIDGNDKTLFQLNNETILNIDSVTIENAASVINATNPDAVINISNSDIANNKKGISSAGQINIFGNSTIANNGNGIALTSETAVLTLDAQNGDITINDLISGSQNESLPKLTMKNGNINLHKQVSDVNVDITSATINLKADNALNGLDVSILSNSTLNYANNSISNIAFNSLSLSDNLNLIVDVDLAASAMDTLSSKSFEANGHNINISDMNLLSDAKDAITVIPFADENTKSDVTTAVKEVAYSPIYKYGVSYDNTTGNFTFQRSGGDKLSYADVNPVIMAAPAAAQIGGYLGMIDTYNHAFNNMDMRMLHPSYMRTAQRDANKYAISDTFESHSFTTNETNSDGVWLRPFTSYDSVGLKNGPKVHNVSYGTFIGGDSAVHQFRNGAEGVLSAHISYLGNHLKFAGNSIWQNGGNIGVTGTYYKGNFFTGLSINTGANASEASTSYGNEDFAMLMAGVASKTGYNIEFKEGRFILQPSMLLSYTFVDTFNYTNAAGIKINPDNLHAIQIQPNLKFSYNTKNHWQPYLMFGINWNIMNDSHFKANMAELPALSVKPFFQYGAGIQKTVKDNLSMFGQIVLRNGGRNGVAGIFGMKWLIGKKLRPSKETI